MFCGLKRPLKNYIVHRIFSNDVFLNQNDLSGQLAQKFFRTFKLLQCFRPSDTILCVLFVYISRYGMFD